MDTRHILVLITQMGLVTERVSAPVEMDGGRVYIELVVFMAKSPRAAIAHLHTWHTGGGLWQEGSG